jgi:predicted nucleic acid-binding protein
VIYVDTSVVLAHVLAEDRHPPAALWDEVLVGSQLVEYETWVRVHAAGLDETHHEAVQATLGRIRLVSLSGEVLERARDPFPAPVRTLDALHLATVVFLQSLGDVRLATYDTRMTHAALAMGIAIEPLPL